MQDTENKAKLIEGPIPATLARMALPILVAMIAMIGFNIVDTYFIAQLGTEQLAAMSFTLAVVMAVNSITMGLGIGTTAVISRAIGKGDIHRTKRVATDAIILGILLTVFLLAGGLFTIDLLFGRMGAEGQVLEYVREYMVIWYLGMPMIVIPQLGNSGIRATGDMRTPATIMLIAMAVNLVLDPMLIFGFGPVPALGLEGAAIATVAARGAAMLMALWVLWRRRLVTMERPSLSEMLDSWKSILTIGVPAGLTQLIVPISTGIITAVVATYGVAAVAGFGVASRLELFAIFTTIAVGSALIPFIGQNWGAGKRDRVRDGIRTAMVFAAVWGAAIWMLFLVTGSSMAGFFDDNPAVIEVIVEYLRIVSPGFALMGVLFVVTSALNALHKSIQSMLLSMLRMFVFYVPLALLGSALFGLSGIWWAALTANLLGGVLGFFWFWHVFHALPIEAHSDTSQESE